MFVCSATGKSVSTKFQGLCYKLDQNSYQSLLQHVIYAASVVQQLFSYTLLLVADKTLLQTDFCAKTFNLFVCWNAQQWLKLQKFPKRVKMVD